MIKVETKTTALRNVIRTVAGSSKELSRAILSAGNMLRQEIKTGMLAESPGGESWPRAHPWTRMDSLKNRYVRRTRTWGKTKYSWTELRGKAKKSKWSPPDTGKKPLAKLARAVRYARQVGSGFEGGISRTDVRIGFLNDRVARLAAYQATGGQMTVSRRMRRLIFAAGLGIKSGTIKVPQRRHVEPVYERRSDAIAAYVSDRVKQKLGQGGI